MKPAITKMKEWLEDYGQTHSHDCPDNLTNVLVKARSLEAEEQAQKPINGIPTGCEVLTCTEYKDGICQLASGCKYRATGETYE